MLLNMGIIKIEVSLPEATRAIETFKQNRVKAFETLAAEIKSAVSVARVPAPFWPVRKGRVLTVPNPPPGQLSFAFNSSPA